METKYTRSILDINNGSIIRDLDRELAKVMVNLADVATDDKPREINLKLKFTPKNDKKEIVFFNHPEELDDIFHYYLRHEDERGQIAERGHKKVLEQHTWQQRMLELTEKMSAVCKNSVM